MSRPDIRIAIITRRVKGKAYLFTGIYFRTSPLKGYQIKNQALSAMALRRILIHQLL
jgi:hypothetical protein